MNYPVNTSSVNYELDPATRFQAYRTLFQTNGRQILNVESYLYDYLEQGVFTSEQVEELVNIAVMDSPSMLEYIPETFKTKEMCNYCVSKVSSTICNVPKEFITQEMCNFAIGKNIYNVRLIPEEFITQEIVDHICDEQPDLLEYLI